MRECPRHRAPPRSASLPGSFHVRSDAQADTKPVVCDEKGNDSDEACLGARRPRGSRGPGAAAASLGLGLPCTGAGRASTAGPTQDAACHVPGPCRSWGSSPRRPTPGSRPACHLQGSSSGQPCSVAWGHIFPCFLTGRLGPVRCPLPWSSCVPCGESHLRVRVGPRPGAREPACGCRARAQRGAPSGNCRVTCTCSRSCRRGVPSAQHPQGKYHRCRPGCGAAPVPKPEGPMPLGARQRQREGGVGRLLHTGAPPVLQPQPPPRRPVAGPGRQRRLLIPGVSEQNGPLGLLGTQPSNPGGHPGLCRALPVAPGLLASAPVVAAACHPRNKRLQWFSSKDTSRRAISSPVRPSEPSPLREWEEKSSSIYLRIHRGSHKLETPQRAAGGRRLCPQN